MKTKATICRLRVPGVLGRTGERRPVRVLAALLSAMLLSPAQPAFADAELFVNPTFVQLSERQRSVAVTIVNRGDAAGVFAIDWVDYAMTEEGRLTVPQGKVPWSLQPHTRYSPRRVTLRPGETQLVKIALRRGGDVAEGEYYSHLKVLTLNDDVDASTETQDGDIVSERRAVTVDARSAIAIPVIWRNSRDAPRAVIESAHFDPAAGELSVDVRRIGLLSTRGYLHVIRTSADGSRRALVAPIPFVIYPSARRRVASIEVDADDIGADDEVEVSYSTDRQDAKSDLASFHLAP